MFMQKRKFNEFMKRYDKFEKNNLPTPFWDEERQTLEYVNIGNRKNIYNFDNIDNKVKVYSNLTNALEDLVDISFYYPFYAKYQDLTKNGNKFVVGNTHTHSFENVVQSLYESPESFYISSEDEQFYSKQELKYLKKLQKYLLFIGLKDVETNKVPISRYRNKLHEKYKNAYIISLNSELLNDILNGKINFIVYKWYSDYKENKYGKNEYQCLITDKEYNFKLFIEYTYTEIKLYKDIKYLYHMDNINDTNKIIVKYFHIIEKY